MKVWVYEYEDFPVFGLNESEATHKYSGRQVQIDIDPELLARFNRIEEERAEVQDLLKEAFWKAEKASREK